jgi:hypothetical protein
VVAELPTWLGLDEEVGPCLDASVEPPGLQVCGLAELDAFDAWNRAFLAGAASLPFRRRT